MESELEVVMMCVLGAQPRLLSRAAGTLNCWAIAPVLIMLNEKPIDTPLPPIHIELCKSCRWSWPGFVPLILPSHEGYRVRDGSVNIFFFLAQRQSWSGASESRCGEWTRVQKAEERVLPWRATGTKSEGQNHLLSLGVMGPLYNFCLPPVSAVIA